MTNSDCKKSARYRDQEYTADWICKCSSAGSGFASIVQLGTRHFIL